MRDDKVIIKCRKCSQKLRVPRDAGKLSVTCPLCKNEFIFNPDDIIFKTTWYMENMLTALKRNVSGLGKAFEAYKNLLGQFKNGKRK